MRDLQAQVQELLDRQVAAGEEGGVQVAVLHHGEVVVDATAGLEDPGALVFAASAAKGIASTVAHVLVERGLLAYDLPLADVWPEFAAHGKGGTTLRHVLLHTAGVPAPRYDTTVEELCDWHVMCAQLAEAEPWWSPGTRFGYHALTFGFLLGEVVRRATGTTLTEHLHELVTGPLGVVGDVHFGVPARLLRRVAPQEPSRVPADPPPLGSPADRAVPPAIRPDAALANRPEVLAADIPSLGTMTAKGAATVYAALLGHVDGVQLVRPERLPELAAVAFKGEDTVMGLVASWAFGYSPFRPGAKVRPGSSFGMLGMNGSAAFGDLDSGVAVGFTRTRYGPSSVDLLAAVDRLVGAAYPAP